MSSDNPSPPDSEAPTLELPVGEHTVTLPIDGAPVQFTDGLEDAETEDMDAALRYRRQHMLGRGGHGYVISVYDRKMQRAVALKISNTTEAERSAKLRFLREAQVTGQLSHPNVMPVHDIGTDPDGQVFFTMKEVQGQSLSQRIRGKTAGSLVERLLTFRQVCNAIAFAHSRGVLHRDIKPANVMVGEYGEVLVVDWGLCKVVGETVEDYEELIGEVTDDALTTREGEVAGTPAYMAPEQALGESDRLSPRTDVYALGATLYTMLTGKPPFEGEVSVVLKRVVTGSFRPPSEVAPRTVPRELSAIVCKAMATRPEDRYPTVAAMSADVQAFLEERPVSVVQYSWLQRAAKWAERNKRVVRPVAFTTALALVILMSGGLVHLNQISEARDEAVAEATRATRAERAATIEVLNGRAALAASDALFGRAGAALSQLRLLRDQMAALDTDTLKVDVGMAILGQAATLPLAVDTKGLNPTDVSIDPETAQIAWVSRGLLSVLSDPTATSADEWPLPADGSHRIGPWGEGGPWLTRSVDNAIFALHSATGVQRMVSDEDCEVQRSITTADWVVAWCKDGRLVQWPWSESSGRREHTADGKVWTPVDVSSDGRRVLVRQYTDSLSEHYAKPVVLEEGRAIWEDPSRSSLLSLSPSGRWLLASSPSGFEIHDIDKDQKTAFDGGVPGAFLWFPDSSGFKVIRTSGEVVGHRIDGDNVRKDETSRLALEGSVERVAGSPDLRTIVNFGKKRMDVFRVFTNDAAVLDLAFGSETEATTESVPSEDGRLVAIGTENGRIFIVDSETGRDLWTLKTTDFPVRGLSFSPSGDRLLSGHWDGRARIWDLSSGTVVREFRPTKASSRGGPPKVTETLFIDQERVLLTGGDGHIGIWSATSGELLQDYTGVVEYVWDSVYSAKTDRLLVTNRLQNDEVGAAILDLASGTVAARVPIGRASYGAAVSPDGRHFVVTSSAQEAVVMDTDGETVAALSVPTPPAYAADWSGDGSLVAISDYSGKYRLWDTRSWELVATFGHQSIVTSLMFDPSGRKLRVMTNTGSLHHLDLNSLKHRAAPTPEWLVALRSSSSEPAEMLRILESAAPTSELAKAWLGSLSGEAE